MSEQLERLTKSLLGVALGTTLGASADIEMEGFSQGTIYIPVGSPITGLTWYGAPYAPDQPSGASGGATAPTYLPLHDATLGVAEGTAITQTVAAGHASALPAALFGCASVKCLVNSAGSVNISLKS